MTWAQLREAGTVLVGAVAGTAGLVWWLHSQDYASRSELRESSRVVSEEVLRVREDVKRLLVEVGELRGSFLSSRPSR